MGQSLNKVYFKVLLHVLTKELSVYSILGVNVVFPLTHINA